MKHKKQVIDGMNRRNLSIVLGALLLAGLWVAASLRPRAPAPPAMDDRYEFRGVVKSVDKTNKRAMIKHEKVGDLMDAMTMSFLIKDRQALNRMEAGDQIQGMLVSTDDGGQWLEQITIIVKGSRTASMVSD